MRKVSTPRRGQVIRVETPEASILFIDVTIHKGRPVVGVTHDGKADISNPFVPLPIPLDQAPPMADSGRR